MANKQNIAPGNVNGDFFTDTTCINCGNCADLAPTVFGKVPSYYVVFKQPETDEELRQTLEALVCCPKGCIGSGNKYNLKEVIDSFPKAIADGVYYLGFNSASSAGGKSFFIEHKQGNWMVDSPKFSPRLVSWIARKGGLKKIFLTHRDDVAEAAEYAKTFGAQRIIHIEDIEAQRDAETIVEGTAPVTIGGDFVIIPTPGHTEGHCMLLFKSSVLFSGDVLTSRLRFDEPLEVWAPEFCWYSWEEQTRSLEKLLAYDFERTVPAHGRMCHGSREEMKNNLQIAIQRCKSETGVYTHSRADYMDSVSAFYANAGQPEFAAKLKERAHEVRRRSREADPAD